MSDLLDKLKAMLPKQADPTIEALKKALGDEATDEVVAAFEAALAADEELRNKLNSVLEVEQKEEVEEIDLADAAAVQKRLDTLEWELGVAKALQGVTLPENTTAEEAAKHVARTQDGTFVYTGERAPGGTPKKETKKVQVRPAPTKPAAKDAPSEEKPKVAGLGTNRTGFA